MGRALSTLCLLSTACATPLESREPTTKELFDGRSLAGWEGNPRFWRVEGGAIVGESTAENPCSETTYLVWRDGEFSDFELELEWRFPVGATDANSGVQFRSRAESPTLVAGYQADLETGPDWTGGLYEQGGRGVVTRRGQLVALDTNGGHMGEPFADAAELLAGVVPGDWNRMRITALGPRLTIEVNGRIFSETIDLDPLRAARAGTFALQLHAGPSMRVEFRGLRLRSLGDWPLTVSRRWPTWGPEWIWPAVEVADHQTAWFRRDFELEKEPARAELWITADNHFDAWLGGQGVATSDDWTRPMLVDVTHWVSPGENELLVRAENDEREVGLVLELTVEFVDGSRFVLQSNEDFESCLEPPEGVKEAQLGAWLDAEAPWKPSRTFGELGVSPWGTLGEALITSGEAPEAETLHVPPGFTVERLYSVPLATQGSWVSLAVDPRGRFYAGDQYGGVFRIEVPPAGRIEVQGQSAEARVTPLPLALGEAQGLLWAFDSLYAVVSGAGEFESGLWRARDTDGDGELERVELLRAFDGDGEHGPHAVVLAPDGESLLVVAGNFTKLPEPLARHLRPENWAEDALLSPLDDPNGHAVGITAPGGWVARTDPEGRSWELVASGLRNAYDLAVSADGELFTYDSDMEWDVGLPWYKPTRVLHVVSGGEYGWRAGSKNWPADSFDALPSAVDLGLGSPTGLVFGTRTTFPAPWRDALFACDWAYGRVFAVHLEPDGASYRGSYEVFASGEPFPVTDAVVGPDGALYLTIGGRQTQSGLYRIAWNGASPAEEPPSADESAELARERRRALERFHSGRVEDEALAVRLAVAELGDPDRFVRHAARIALEHLEPDAWRDLVLAEESPRASLEGLLALVHGDPSYHAGELVERALAIFRGAGERQERLDSLRLLELVLLRRGAREERAAIRAALDPAYPSGDSRLDRALLDLLVYLDADVAGRALAQLEAVSSQEERIAILNAWRALDVYTDESTPIHFLRALEREIAGAEGGLSVRGYLEAMRSEVIERTGSSAASSAEHETVPAAARAPSGAASVRPGAIHPWTVAELEPRLAEIARARSFERGRAAYEAASCAQCHRLAGEGANLGPDLTGCSGRFSARDLLVAILEPSREVPDVWRDLELWGVGGEDVDAVELLAVGRLESEDEGELVVREASGESVRVPVASVGERLPHRLSRMPEALLDTLSEDEILDLLAYVLSGGEPEDERFGDEADPPARW